MPYLCPPEDATIVDAGVDESHESGKQGETDVPGHRIRRLPRSPAATVTQGIRGWSVLTSTADLLELGLTCRARRLRRSPDVVHRVGRRRAAYRGR